MKLNYSESKIYTGGIDINTWSKLSAKEKKDALSKSWYVYYSFRNPKTNKLQRQTNIKAGVNLYKDKKSRHSTCPNCNKKSFVKYINNETNLYLNATIGRCDREIKCGYFKKSSGNTISTICNTNCNTTVLQTTYHNKKLLQLYSNSRQESNFITYLRKHFT
jgi:hypothetical protein